MFICQKLVIELVEKGKKERKDNIWVGRWREGEGKMINSQLP